MHYRPATILEPEVAIEWWVVFAVANGQAWHIGCAPTREEAMQIAADRASDSWTMMIGKLDRAR